MLFYILFLILIPTILSYIILKLIYTKIFKSQKKVSKILVFLGSVGLIIFYYTPYSYYLEPSFWEFRNICKLDPEIYQANGGKLDEEYYNKILKYHGVDLDSLAYRNFQETTTLSFYEQKPPYKKRKMNDADLYDFYPLHIVHKEKTFDSVSLLTGIVFNSDNPQSKQEVENVYIDPEWQTYRIEGMFWNISTDGRFGMPTKILFCNYFKD